MTTPPWLIYVRVSTDEQAREGVSLEAQRDACVNYLRALGITQYEVLIDDGWSAWAKGHMKRPGMLRILHGIRSRSIAGVVVWSLDRFIRINTDLVATIDLMAEHGVDFAAVTQHINTSGPMGRFQLQLFGALAELESGRTSERIRSAKAHIREKGGWSGGRPPPGTRVVGEPGDRRLEVDGATAPVVAGGFRAYAGGASLRDVGVLLHRGGACGRRTPTNTAAMLRNDWLVRTGVVDRALFDEVGRALTARWSGPKAAAGHATGSGKTLGRSPNARTERNWPLHGLAFCGRCGSAFIGAMAGGRTKRHPYLRCAGRNRGTCAQPDLPAEAWEKAIVRQVQKAAMGKDWSKAWAGYALRVTAGNAETLARRDALAKERGQAATTLERLLDLIAEGSGGAVTRERVAKLEKRVAELDHDLAKVAGSLSAIDLLDQRRAFMQAAIKQASERLPEAGHGEINGILAGIVTRITLRDDPGSIVLDLFVPGRRGGPGFESESHLVDQSGLHSNQGPTLSYAVSISRQGQAFEVFDAEEEPDVPAFLAWLRAEGPRAAAPVLGVTDRQVRRILAGRVSAAALRGMARRTITLPPSPLPA